MAFLTPEQIKAVRVKGSTKHVLERLEKTVLIVHMSADAALELREYQKKGEGSDGRKAQRDMFLHMLTQAIATEDGDLLPKSDAEQLMKVLNMGEVTALINKVNERLTEALGEAGKATGQPVPPPADAGTSSSASA